MRSSIKTKIMFLCGVFLLLFILSASILMINLRSVIKNFGQVVHDTEHIVAKSYLLGKIVSDIEAGQRGFVITGEESFLKPCELTNEEFDGLIAELRKDLSHKPEYLKMLEEIDHLRGNWLRTAANSRSMNDVALSVRKGSGKKIIDELKEVSNRFSIALEDEMREKYARSKNIAKLTNISSLIVCGFGIFASVLLSVFIGKSIIKPISILIKGTEKIREGDLGYKINIDNQDELGLLAESFNKMTSDLKNSIDNLNSVNHRLHVNEQHLRNINQQLISEIDERKKAEENLEASNQDLKDFVYIASHDLREPSRKIASFGKMIANSLDVKLSDDDRENLDFMIDGAERMFEMVESLLIYSRVTTREITFEDIDLNEVIEHLKKLELADSIAATGGILSVPKILPSVHGGYSQIRQVLQNLIGNALKYHKKDTPPQIAIRAVRQGDMIRVGVQDNGIGIREIHYDNIFVMFRRVDAKPEYKGSGIGLSVCKKIIERHNGKIGVVSTYGQGSTFWFTVPAAKTADVQQVQSEQVTTSHSL